MLAFCAAADWLPLCSAETELVDVCRLDDWGFSSPPRPSFFMNDDIAYTSRDGFKIVTVDDLGRR